MPRVGQAPPLVKDSLLSQLRGAVEWPPESIWESEVLLAAKQASGAEFGAPIWHLLRYENNFFFPSISENLQVYYGLYNIAVMDLPFRLFIRNNFWKGWEISFLKEHYTLLALFSALSLSCLQDVLKHSVGLGLTRQIDLYFRLCLVISMSCFHLIETCRYHSSA